MAMPLNDPPKEWQRSWECDCRSEAHYMFIAPMVKDSIHPDVIRGSIAVLCPNSQCGFQKFWEISERDRQLNLKDIMRQISLSQHTSYGDLSTNGNQNLVGNTTMVVQFNSMVGFGDLQDNSALISLLNLGQPSFGTIRDNSAKVYV
ncbi:hypothetical protein F4781DRAFT_289223 [Annulohypoxylon bovei var. microspora]|nr:hypothetical protein F4781DRAFT_289223 [Annulohypoxylon bovei var. microspora]